MKKLKLWLLTILFPVAAIAQEDKITYDQTTLTCTTEQSLKQKLQEFEEKPMLIGVSVRSITTKNDSDIQFFVTILYTNPKTGNWSLIEKHPDSTMCVVAVGHKLTMIER